MEVRTGPCLCGEPEKVVEENGKQVLLRCPLYVKLIGKNPATGQPIEEWGCAIAWLPMLLIEGSKETRQTAAAIEHFRNEMVLGQQKALASVAKQKLLDIPPTDITEV